MKKLISAFLLFLFCFSPAFCDPYTGQSSSWKNKNDTIVVSSTTPTLIDTVNGGYRAVALCHQTSQTTVHFTVDGTSTTVATTGWPFNPIMPGITIDYNNKIYLQLEPGANSITLYRILSTR